VFDAHVVSAAEGGTILIAFGLGDRRMPVLFAILDVRFAMIFEVPSSSLDSVMKAATANFVVVAGRALPGISAIVLARPVLG